MEHLPLISLLSCLFVLRMLFVYLFNGILCNLLISKILYDFQFTWLFFIELWDGFHGDDSFMDGISWTSGWLKEWLERHFWFTFLLFLDSDIIIWDSGTNALFSLFRLLKLFWVTRVNAIVNQTIWVDIYQRNYRLLLKALVRFELILVKPVPCPILLL